MQLPILAKVRTKLSRKRGGGSASASGSDTSDEATERVPCLQVQSSLLSKLSAELRLSIYSYALGDPERPMHIIPYGRSSIRLTHIRCWDMNSPLPSWQHHCFMQPGYAASNSVQFQSSPLRVNDNLLSLLLTCRIVCTEALEALYSSNMFDFKGARCFLDWFNSIPASHLIFLRRIRISTVFYLPMPNWADVSPLRFPPERLDRWNELCALLSRSPLSNLKSLHLEVIVKTDLQNPLERQGLLQYGNVTAIFEPLKDIRVPEFVLETNVNIENIVPVFMGSAEELPFTYVGKSRLF